MRTSPHAYGDTASQFGELTVPSDAPRGVAVVIHGGFWKEAYDLSLGRPLARDLAEAGWVTWNLEYRRVGRGPGGGGGVPQTLDDIAVGIDHLAALVRSELIPAAALGQVVALGHSAGGHLAAWAAARTSPAVPITHVIAQAGVLDLRAAARDGLGGGAVRRFLGSATGVAATAGDVAVDPSVDPMQQLPLGVPVWCVHAPDDDVVPVSQSRDYVDRARRAGADATYVEVTGGHFDVIDVGSDAWGRIRRILATLPDR